MVDIVFCSVMIICHAACFVAFRTRNLIRPGNVGISFVILHLPYMYIHVAGIPASHNVGENSP